MTVPCAAHTSGTASACSAAKPAKVQRSAAAAAASGAPPLCAYGLPPAEKCVPAPLSTTARTVAPRAVSCSAANKRSSPISSDQVFERLRQQGWVSGVTRVAQLPVKGSSFGAADLGSCSSTMATPCGSSTHTRTRRGPVRRATRGQSEPITTSAPSVVAAGSSVWQRARRAGGSEARRVQSRCASARAAAAVPM
eukprot:scaffold3476_cov68-Phaeocystis_antarctica.AAC.5